MPRRAGRSSHCSASWDRRTVTSRPMCATPPRFAQLFREYGRDIALVIHAAAQPSHDWAARRPRMDFAINAQGTLNLLEATRRRAPGAAFIFTSTNKVYGDSPNRLPLVECATRWEIEDGHSLRGRYSRGPVDRSDPAQPVRGVEGGGRRDGAGVRPVLRPLDRLLQGRVPDRPQSQRQRAARISLVSDEVCHHRHALHRLRSSRKAGPRQPPQRRSHRGIRSLLPRAPRGRGLQHRRRPPEPLLGHRSHRDLRTDCRAAAALDVFGRQSPRRSHVVDQRAVEVLRALPRLAGDVAACRRSAARSTKPVSERWSSRL